MSVFGAGIPEWVWTLCELVVWLLWIIYVWCLGISEQWVLRMHFLNERQHAYQQNGTVTFLSYKTPSIISFYFYEFKGWMSIIFYVCMCQKTFHVFQCIFTELFVCDYVVIVCLLLCQCSSKRWYLYVVVFAKVWWFQAEVAEVKFDPGRVGRWCSTRPAARPGTVVGSWGRWSCRMGLLAPRSGRRGWGRTALRHHTNWGWKWN